MQAAFLSKIQPILQDWPKSDTLAGMKLFRTVFLGLLFVCAVLLPTAMALGEQKDTLGLVTGDAVALRSAPETGAPLLQRLEKGTFVTVLETNVNGGWHFVRLGDETGYINRLYLTLDPSLESYQNIFTAVAEKNPPSIYCAPREDGEIIGRAKSGEALEVLYPYPAPNWHGVFWQGQMGYVLADQVKLLAQGDPDELTELTITGGRLSPDFSPKEYGYILEVTDPSGEITVAAKANPGVTVSIGDGGADTFSAQVDPESLWTIPVFLNGQQRYEILVVRDVLTVGTWNIKRGNKNLVEQARLIRVQNPDLMSFQEAYQNHNRQPQVDNLKSLATDKLRFSSFGPAIIYEEGGLYGNGILSAYRILEEETVPLTSLNKEDRSLQKTVFSIQGRRVSLYNTHLSYESTAIRNRQMQEIKTILNNDPNPYIILTGDFNLSAWKVPELPGFQMLNGGDTVFFGYDGAPFKRSTVDNIFVSNNFHVLGVHMIDTKLSDHKPLFAYLAFNGEG